MLLRTRMIPHAAAIVAFAGCGGAEPTARPPEVPYAFLSARVEEALRDVEEARSTLVADSAPDAAGRLDRVAVTLGQVIDYYLPLLEARGQVSRARTLVAASPATSRAAIDSAATFITAISTGHAERVAAEMREPLARLDEARTALDARRIEEARRVLDRLDQQLELLYFRGEIVLEGSEVDSPPPDDGRE